MIGSETYRQGLEANIFKFNVFRIFTKRIYLPLIAIYSVTVAGVSLFELGIIAAVTSAVSLALEVPSGYVSDKVGHKKSLVLGTFISALAPLSYIAFPTFSGALFGSVLFFGGYSFISGTLEAFIHETLLELDRDRDYGKVLGHAQAWGLMGNAILLALVPLLYPLNPMLPFLIAFFLQLINFFIALSFTTPIKTKRSVQELEEISFRNLVKSLRKNHDYVIFTFLGILTAVSHKVPEFREIYLQELGFPIIYLGFLIAVASLLGGIASFNLHKITATFDAKHFYMLDYLIVIAGTIAIGLSSNLYLTSAAFVLFSAYGRNRKGLIDAYVISQSPTRELKATYISILAFFEALSGIWIPLFLGYAVGTLGPRLGYIKFGLTLALPLLLLYFIYVKRKSTARLAV